MDIVNEKSTRKLEIYFKDQDEQDVIPDECSYLITDITDEESPVEILAVSSFQPPAKIGQASQITLTKTDNRILETINDYEKRVVTITWKYNQDQDEENVEFPYLIKNLHGIT